MALSQNILFGVYLMSRTVKKIAPIASVALPFIAPGIGTAIGAGLGLGSTAAPIVGNALIGGGLSAAGGGDLGDVALGAASGGLAGGGGELLAGKAGLTGTAQQAVGRALTGAAAGGATGGAEGALLGGAIGGATPFVSNAIGGGTSETVGGMTVPTRKPTGLSTLTQGAQPMRLGSLLSAGTDLYGYGQGRRDLEDIEDIYNRQYQAAQQQLQPYAQAGEQALANIQAPDLEALQTDPGYQFRLAEGNQALERSLAARGLGQSGAALKAAQRYGQGLADQTYQDFYNRQLGLVNQGQQAATGLGSMMTNLGEAQAMRQAQEANLRNQALSGLIGTYDDDNQLTGSFSRLLRGFA